MRGDTKMSALAGIAIMLLAGVGCVAKNTTRVEVTTSTARYGSEMATSTEEERMRAKTYTEMQARFEGLDKDVTQLNDSVDAALIAVGANTDIRWLQVKEELRTKRENAVGKLYQLKMTTDDSWGSVKSEAEAAIDAFEDTFLVTKANLRANIKLNY